MRVLVACEFSGRVRDAFARRGWDAWSCDLLPTESPGQHIQGDVLEHLGDGWDLMIAHPPCTHLATSGARHFAVKREAGLILDAVLFFLRLASAPIERICIENPVGIMSTIWKEPDQIIQPYHFGEAFQKTTCLWLQNLPRLVCENIEAPLFGEHVDKGEFVTFASGKRHPKWYADALALPIEERRSVRSTTFQGIADAMAEQWGKV